MNMCLIKTRIIFGILFGSKLKININFVWQEVIYYGGFGFDQKHFGIPIQSFLYKKKEEIHLQVTYAF